ncbi:tyrosine-type recombinase/integrase [Bacteroides sp.]|uniref:tyrosine-type recombinase/integrase n=1 Tax=Bacteroides sp. TaxID=29523 RepID=UPI002FCABFDE
MASLSPTILTAKPTIEGKFAIFIRISVKKLKAYIKTNYLIDDLSQWYNGKVVARSDAAMMNKRILFELKKYEDRLRYIENEDYYTPNQLKFMLTQEDRIAPNVITFNDYFRQRINEIKEEGRDGYAKMNTETLRVFELSEKEVPLPVMNHIIIEHFNNYMIKKGYSDGNRQLRLCHVKARVNEAIKYGLLRSDVHPFAYTKLPKSDPKELDININDFRQIVSHDFSHSKRMTFGRDMLLLSFYLGGVNLADIAEINFSGTEISYVRKKSGAHKKKNRITCISVPEEARSIISKYIGRNGMIDFGYKYTYENLCRYINSCLKLIAKEIGINSNISFYSARKTFAQYASELAIPYPIIEYCLGHSIKTGITINSYIRIKPEQANAAIKRVIEYTKNPEVFKEFINFRAQMQIMMM